MGVSDISAKLVSMTINWFQMDAVYITQHKAIFQLYGGGQ